MTTGENRGAGLESNANCQDLANWIAETDANLAAAVADLETNPPTVFDDKRSILESVERAARLAGRREVLDELIEHIEK